MKTAIIAWTLNIILVVGLYSVLKPEKEVGYTEAQRVWMDGRFEDDLASNVRALSVADIGLDAEQFMDGVRK